MATLRTLLDSDPQHRAKALELMRKADSVHLITFGNFSKLAKRRGWTVEMLAERFEGRIEKPAKFFERVLNCSAWIEENRRFEAREDVVIPYKAVLEFYQSESALEREKRTNRKVRSAEDRPTEHNSAPTLRPLHPHPQRGRKRIHASKSLRQKAYRTRRAAREFGDEAHGDEIGL